MARRQKMREVAQDVQEVRQTIDNALDRGVTFQFQGENHMHNDEEIVPAATENVSTEPTHAPEPQAEVVVQRDTTPAEQQALAAREAEDEANLSDTEELRRFSEEELRARGVPASSIPRNAASAEPDLDPEKARELERRAAASPTLSFDASDEGNAASGEGEGEAVG